MMKTLIAALAAILPLTTAIPPPADVGSWLVSNPPLPASPKDVKNLDDLPVCGGQHYSPLEYTCFGEQVLCPWENGFPQDRCGISNKCYLPFRYGCDNGNLVELPTMQQNFQLMAVNLPGIFYQPIKACGQRFWLKEGDSCTYCPQRVTELNGTCPEGKDTVFGAGSGYLNTVVPGGQRSFVDPADGTFGFTQAHSSRMPENALQSYMVLENGTFAVEPAFGYSKGWVACPADPKNESTPQSATHQIFAMLPGLDHKPECLPINLVTDAWKPANASAPWAGAWQYI